jgi:hypothetical protein
MKKSILILSIVTFTVMQSLSQGLYMPVEIQNAYKNGTRNTDGTVPDGYWQNESSYDIKVQIDPATKLLTGSASITYTNNSPDSLNQIVFHAYHDYYKPGARRAGFFSSADATSIDNEGMVLDKVVVSGNEIDMSNRQNYRYNGTNYALKLSENLAPGSSIDLQIDWHFTIVGEGFERSGAINETSMFIAYWHPEIAVYDDVFGWDQILYDASAEFYHDVSDFKVEVTVPDNFIVWASVAPDNGDDIYPRSIQKQLKKAIGSTEKITVVSSEDWDKGIQMKSNTWKYTATDFPDFSFALSDHFIWEASSYEDQFGSYFLHSVYDPKNTGFASVIDTQKESLRVFHNEFPVYEFPYHYFTIFNGLQGGGMEFAGMANDQAYSGEQFSRWLGKEISDFDANLGLSMHEMCHMYFPFLMGINEKRYAWMDEGWASFTDYFQPVLWSSNYDKPYLASSTVLPVMVPTYAIPSHSGLNSYTIGSHSYHALYNLLGEEDFTKALKFYMDTWKMKHPTPYDFFNAFETSTGTDLDWFWNGWYFDWGYMDLGIESFENGKLTIKNHGGRPMSMKITYTFEDDSQMTEQLNPIVWKESDTHSKNVNFGKPIKKIMLSVMESSDANAENNVWEK